MGPTVSVIMIAHREGKLAAATVASIKKSMEFADCQNEITFEVVVVLDSPNVETMQLFVSPFADRLVLTEFGDPGLARNVGVAAASSEFVAMFDADNLVSENWIDRCVEESKRLKDGKWVLHPKLEIGF